MFSVVYFGETEQERRSKFIKAFHSRLASYVASCRPDPPIAVYQEGRKRVSYILLVTSLHQITVGEVPVWRARIILAHPVFYSHTAAKTFHSVTQTRKIKSGSRQFDR